MLQKKKNDDILIIVYCLEKHQFLLQITQCTDSFTSY